MTYKGKHRARSQVSRWLYPEFTAGGVTYQVNGPYVAVLLGFILWCIW